MSDNQNSGFGKFVPGFDFLQNLTKGASESMPQMPNLSSWVAPTLNLEELEKRIGELKAVHFWLDQNSKALAATVQALEVQKMTLATLKGMNFNMGEVAEALKLKAGAGFFGAGADSKHGAASTSGAKAPGKDGAAAKPASGLVDPLQWWGAVTQQFQQIAANAMKEATSPAPAKAAAAQPAAAEVESAKAVAPAKSRTKPPAGAAKKAGAKRAATKARR